MITTQTSFDVPGARIYARIVGDHGPAVVLVHGIMVNGHVWDPILATLSQHLQLIVLDLPLGGHTVAMDADASGELAAHADRLIRVIESLDRSVLLVGSDTGGAIAQLAVVQRPDLFDGLVLLPSDAFDNCPPVLLRPLRPLAHVPGALTTIASMLRFHLIQKLMMLLVSSQPHRPEDLTRLLGALPRDAGVQRDLIKLVQGLRAEVTERVAEKLPTFDRPVLILWSTKDPLFPLKHAHRLADAFPNARLETVDGARAFISLDQPRWLAEQITDFTATLGR